MLHILLLLPWFPHRISITRSLAYLTLKFQPKDLSLAYPLVTVHSNRTQTLCM